MVNIFAFIGAGITIFIAVYLLITIFYNRLRIFIILHIAPIFIPIFRDDFSHRSRHDFYIQAQIIQGGFFGINLDENDVLLATDHLLELVRSNITDKKLSVDIVMILSRAMFWHNTRKVKLHISNRLSEILQIINFQHFGNLFVDFFRKWVSRIFTSYSGMVLVVVIELFLLVFAWPQIDNFSVYELLLVGSLLIIFTLIFSYIPLYARWIGGKKAAYVIYYSALIALFNLFFLGWYLAIFSSINHSGIQTNTLSLTESIRVVANINGPKWISLNDYKDSQEGDCMGNLVEIYIETEKSLNRLKYDHVGLSINPEIVNIVDENCVTISSKTEIPAEQESATFKYYIMPTSRKLFSGKQKIQATPVFYINGSYDLLENDSISISIEPAFWSFLRKEFSTISIGIIFLGVIRAIIKVIQGKNRAQ